MNKIGNFLISLMIFTTCFISNRTLAGSKVYFVHGDHLSTPQVITDADQQVVWKVENQSAFGGETEIDQDPDGDGEELVFNLRFPGQYFDSETGLHYNYYRDYDPSLGRYIQSDPIGVAGGINPYIYVENNPLIYYDPDGLTLKQKIAQVVLTVIATIGGNGDPGTPVAPPGRSDPTPNEQVKEQQKKERKKDKGGKGKGKKDFGFPDPFAVHTYVLCAQGYMGCDVCNFLNFPNPNCDDFSC